MLLRGWGTVETGRWRNRCTAWAQVPTRIMHTDTGMPTGSVASKTTAAQRFPRYSKISASLKNRAFASLSANCGVNAIGQSIPMAGSSQRRMRSQPGTQ